MISTISRSPTPGCALHQRFDRGPPVRIHRGVGRDVEAEPHVRRRRKFGDGEFEHAVVDQPDQAQSLGDRDDIGRQQRLAVLLLHPHQAFVERRLPRARLDHRLERRDDAALVQRGDDLVGDADVDAALGIAFDIRRHSANDPARRRLAPSSVSWARLTASSALRA